MRRIICSLLITTFFLSSVPIHADAYPPNMFVEDSPSDQGCEVTPNSQTGLPQEEAHPQIETSSTPEGQEIVPVTDQGDYTDQESFVSPATQDQEEQTQKKRWQHILLAAGAVIVAVTAMLVVDSNDGHSRHHSHKPAT